MENIPPNVLKRIKGQNLSPSEKKQLLDDLEQQFIKRAERKQKHEEDLANDAEYDKWYTILNEKLK